MTPVPLTHPWFEAHFIGQIGPDDSLRRLPSIDGAQGVMLVSPCAFGVDEHAHSVVVPFANPRGAPPVPASFLPRSARWQMSGSR